MKGARKLLKSGVQWVSEVFILNLEELFIVKNAIHLQNLEYVI